jgi:hypothetical protein
MLSRQSEIPVSRKALAISSSILDDKFQRLQEQPQLAAGGIHAIVHANGGLGGFHHQRSRRNCLFFFMM